MSKKGVRVLKNTHLRLISILTCIVIACTVALVITCSDEVNNLADNNTDSSPGGDKNCQTGQIKLLGECVDLASLPCLAGEQNDGKGNCLFDVSADASKDNPHISIQFQAKHNPQLIDDQDFSATFVVDSTGGTATITPLVKSWHDSPRVFVPTITVPSGIVNVTANGAPLITITRADQEPTETIPAQDYSTPVEYSITTVSGEVYTYTVSVTLQPSLLWFSFFHENNPHILSEKEEEEIEATFTDNAGTIELAVASSVTSPRSFIPSFDVSAGSTVFVNDVAQETGVSSQDFSNPVEYTVISDGVSKTYSIDISLLGLFESFSFEKTSNPNILHTTQLDTNVLHDITTSNIQLLPDVPVSWKSTQATRSILIPSFVASEGAQVTVQDTAQISGTSQHDYSAAVTYTVTGENGTSKNVTIQANVYPNLIHVNSYSAESDDYLINEPSAVVTKDVGGTSYVFVASFGDDSVSVFKVETNGELTEIQSLEDTSTTTLSGASALATLELSGVDYLLVAGSGDDGVSVFSIATTGMLTYVSKETKRTYTKDNNEQHILLGGADTLAVATIEGTQYVFVGGSEDNAVNVFSVGTGGTLTHVVSVQDTTASTSILQSPSDLATVAIGGATYLFVPSALENGITVFSVDASGTLTQKVVVNDNTTLKMKGAEAVETLLVDGTTYLYVAGYDEDGINTFAVSAEGALTHKSTIIDDEVSMIDGPTDLSAVEIDGNPYIIATGYNDNGVSIFTVDTDGSLIHNAGSNTSNDYSLETPVSVTHTSVGGTPYIIVATEEANGISVFE